MVNLKSNPFFLDDEAVKWVNETLNSMTFLEKIGQLFCPIGFTNDENILKNLTSKIGIGGIMYRPGNSKDMQNVHRFLQDNSKIPLLIGANLESGGNGIVSDGTNYGKPMQVAATNDEISGYRLGKVACSEGASVGCNWAFAPIVDIDMNFRNPITNLRTFGNDADLIIKMAKGYLKAADECGVAVSIKHFPGDGVDERDQHLLTSVNSLSVDEWDETYGKIYKSLIDIGAKTVMVGHISQPSYTRFLNPKIGEYENIPASLCPELLQKLLRNKLKFNGLIVSDASLMIGFTSYMKRERAVPYCIAAGCDMFLFNKNFEEDYKFMIKGYKKGIITTERLNEAVTRILATKASLNLHIKKANRNLVPSENDLNIISCENHREWARECADKSITLVKNKEKIIPLSPFKYKRVLLNVLEENDDLNSPLKTLLKEKFEKEGFEVTIRNRSQAKGQNMDETMALAFTEIVQSVEDFKKDKDLIIYVANYETASNNTVIRLSFKGLLGIGNDYPWFAKEVPTMFISLANPYHLLDVPFMKTFINAYTFSDDVIDKLMEKIMGRSEFKGISPVDPFCSRWDTKC